MQPGSKLITPLLLTFVLIAAIIFFTEPLLTKSGIYANVLHGANVLILLLSLIVFFIQYKAMHSSNPHAFVRAVMTGMIIKMFVSIGAVLVYYAANPDGFSKMSVAASLVIYLLYMAVENVMLRKLNRKKNA